MVGLDRLVVRAIWIFPKLGVPKMDGENNGKPENPIKMDYLGFPIFLETPI